MVMQAAQNKVSMSSYHPLPSPWSCMQLRTRWACQHITPDHDHADSSEQGEHVSISPLTMIMQAAHNKVSMSAYHPWPWSCRQLITRWACQHITPDHRHDHAGISEQGESISLESVAERHHYLLDPHRHIAMQLSLTRVNIRRCRKNTVHFIVEFKIPKKKRNKVSSVDHFDIFFF
jgi:hypothetical protein